MASKKHRVQYIINVSDDPPPASASSRHRVPLLCDVCGKYFSRTGDLTKHMRNVHRGEKRHQCSVCDKRFSEKGNLNKHTKRFHTATKHYRCDKDNCSKSFATSDALLRHVRQVHRL